MIRLGGLNTTTSGVSYVAQDQNDKLWVWGYNADRSIYARNAANILIPFENTPQCLSL
jgi:hypothetical protein